MFGEMKFNFKKRELIVISSDSEDGVDDNFPNGYNNTAVQDTFKQKKTRKSKSIDQIADNYSKKVKKSVDTKSIKSEPVSTDNSVLRDLTKCSKWGLRKVVKQSSNFQYNSNSLKPDQDENNQETIKYLIHKKAPKKQDNEKNSNCCIVSDDDSIDEETKETNKELDKGYVKKCLNFMENFKKVKSGKLDIKDVCLSCGDTDNIVCQHPVFEGGLCGSHQKMFQEWYFKYDADGSCSYCSVCCQGDEVIICGKASCGKCYCVTCIECMVSEGEYQRLSEINFWICFFCDSNQKKNVLIQRREDWEKGLEGLFSSQDEAKSYLPFLIPCPVSCEKRRPIRVLSLFDGIATGLLAIKQLGLKVGKFVACEIDESAIRLVQNRHTDIVHVGDITKLTDHDIKQLGPFDLVMGGSPCNDLSGANPRRRGLLDAEGTGCLFFDFYRVLSVARPNNDCHCNVESQRPFFWLFENVLSMKLVERDRISRFLQCDPILADARTVSAAARPRLFWGNLPHMRQLNLVPASDSLLTVQSCLERDRTATVEKLNTITTKPGSLFQGVTRIPPVKHKGKDDVLWTTEIERIFGVPEHYTDVNNLGPKERLALLGRSWSVPVMRQMLAPLKEYFASST